MKPGRGVRFFAIYPAHKYHSGKSAKEASWNMKIRLYTMVEGGIGKKSNQFKVSFC
jgi:hypothetical protein